MSDDLHHGRAFECDDLWRDVLRGQIPHGESIFPPLDTHIPSLKTAGQDEDHDFFGLNGIKAGLPELGLVHGEVESFDESPPSTFNDQESGPQDELEHDLWSLFSGEDAAPSPPKIFTWEDFSRKDIPGASRIALLSEAGPAAFNAALDSVKSNQEPTGLLPQDYTLRAYCNLVLGRSSTMFRWDDRQQQFVQTVEDVVISGTSRSCSASLMRAFIASGSTLKKLRVFVDQPVSTRFSCAALLALKSCIASVLNAVEESATSGIKDVRTFIQLQCLIDPFSCLVSSLDTLVKDSRHCTNDESLISAVADHVHNAVQTEYHLCPVYRSLLARVSAPWLEEIARDVGMAPSDDVARSDFKTSEGNSTLVDSADRDLIEQTAASVDLLRKLAPNHALLHNDQSDGCLPLLSRLAGPNASSPLPAQRSNVGHEHDAIILSGNSSWKNTSPGHAPSPSEVMDDQAQYNEQAAAQGYLDDMNAIVFELPATLADQSHDELHNAVAALGRTCLHEDSLDPEELMTQTSIRPFEQMRPLVQQQHRQVNGVLLRQLFKKHNLRDHMQLQRAFHLFGNADFVDRLSTALFSSDVQSAERRRGTIPTGQLMGLRLGVTHEERWPPASSELRLTLTGTLNETYRGSIPGKSSTPSNNAILPGGLSFSIRELPEHEIDRVLDPNSIYALDFLRLQYTAEAPLSAIITTQILNKYDDIFRFLLKLLRLVHVTANLTRKLKDDAISGSIRKFASHANHLVSVLMSHVMAVGVDEPWSTMMRHFHDIERTLKLEDTERIIDTRVTCSMESLRQAHDTCLERIRTRLFLKRRQDKLHLAIEDVLAIILRTAFILQAESSEDANTIDDQLRELREAAKRACASLQDQIDRLPKSANDADFEDAEAHKILLARLNWNGYYL